MFAFTKVFLAVLAVVSSVCATITINPPNIIGNSSNTISWSSSDIEADPPVFSVELINKVFNSQFALANNVQTTQGSITFDLPVVAPGPGYTLEFVDIGNINMIFAQTGGFSVQQHDANSPLPSTTSGAASSSSSTLATSRSSTTARSTVTQSSSSTSSSTTIPPTTIKPTSISSAVSSTSTGAPSASPSSGAVGLVPAGSFAALVAGALALAL